MIDRLGAWRVGHGMHLLDRSASNTQHTPHTQTGVQLGSFCASCPSRRNRKSHPSEHSSQTRRATTNLDGSPVQAPERRSCSVNAIVTLAQCTLADRLSSWAWRQTRNKSTSKGPIFGLENREFNQIKDTRQRPTCNAQHATRNTQRARLSRRAKLRRP